jgi:transposase
MNYIAMDCHISTLEFAVVNESGRITQEKRVNTGVKELIEFVKSVPKPRKIIMEEGTLASWVLEMCTDFGEELIITDPKTNRWIGQSGQKNDAFDARRLGQLARGGYIKEIHHPKGNRRRFRELVLSYHDTVKSETRIKNKLKAKFRQNGISCNGETVYLDKHREEWKKKLPKDKVVHLVVEGLWSQLDKIQEVKDGILQLIRTQGRHYPEIKRFKEMPGIGPIHAATISAILETPNRFANKKKVWTYAGLGIMEKSSGGKLYSRKLTRDYNRLLKYSLKQAAESAISASDNPFRRHYLQMTLEKGIPPHRARLTVARSIVATLYGMWKSGGEYDPDIKEKNAGKKQTDSSNPSC